MLLCVDYCKLTTETAVKKTRRFCCSVRYQPDHEYSAVVDFQQCRVPSALTHMHRAGMLSPLQCQEIILAGYWGGGEVMKRPGAAKGCLDAIPALRR